MKNTNTYTVYIDESNIATNIGHSVYGAVFVICVYKNFLNNNIIKIENDLKISYTHWVDMLWKLRIRFAEKIKNLDFICKFAIYDNPIVKEKVLKNFLVEVINTDDNIYRIIIDGKNGKRYERKLKSSLKKYGIGSGNIKFVDDKSEPLIRLCDFMSGLIRSCVDDKNKYNGYIFKILQDKIKIPD